MNSRPSILIDYMSRSKLENDCHATVNDIFLKPTCTSESTNTIHDMKNNEIRTWTIITW